MTVLVRLLFKGEVSEGDTLEFESITYCEPIAWQKGDWLIYCSKAGELFKMNECGLSRSLKHPENNLYFDFSPSPPPIGWNNWTKRKWRQLSRNQHRANVERAEVELDIEPSEFHERQNIY